MTRRRLLPLLIWLLVTGHSPLVDADTVNRIAVIVNDDVIMEGDVVSSVNALLSEHEAPPTDPAQMRRVVLQRLIEQRLIVQEAKRAGVTAVPEELARRFDDIRGHFDSDEAFRQWLETAGLSEEGLRDKIRDEYLAQRLIDGKIRSAIVVSPQEVASELESHPELAKSGDRVRVSHLLIRVNEKRSEENARALIDQIRRQLKPGGDFAALARRYSEDPHREDGGMMGWVAPGELLPELDEALTHLDAGALSDPIRTRLGFHLLRVEERRSVSSLSLMEANRAVYQRLFEQKFEAAFKQWLAELMKRAYIEIVTPDGK